MANMHSTDLMTSPGKAASSKFFDKFAFFFSHQGGPCGFFEMQFYKCMEAYGGKYGIQHCDLERRDIYECVTKEKQMKRAHAIREERWKQYWEGKRKTPYDEDHYEPGTYRPDYFSHRRVY